MPCPPVAPRFDLAALTSRGTWKTSLSIAAGDPAAPQRLGVRPGPRG